MPAPRLPWIKFWPEALEHEKFAGLSDAEAWTWIVVWAKASQQPKRWRFASVVHASTVSGRPVKYITKLIRAGLLDETAEGIVVHDAPDWQDSSRFSPTHREGWRNGGRTVTEQPPNSDATLIQNHAKGDLEGEGDIDREKDISAPKGAARRGNLRVSAVIDAFRAITGNPEPAFSDRDRAAIKRCTAEPELIAEAYLSVESGEWGDDFQRRRLSVHEACDWVNAYVLWRDKSGVGPMKLSAKAG